jgi:hypothetical protein
MPRLSRQRWFSLIVAVVSAIVVFVLVKLATESKVFDKDNKDYFPLIAAGITGVTNIGAIAVAALVLRHNRRSQRNALMVEHYKRQADISVKWLKAAMTFKQIVREADKATGSERNEKLVQLKELHEEDLDAFRELLLYFPLRALSALSNHATAVKLVIDKIDKHLPSDEAKKAITQLDAQTVHTIGELRRLLRSDTLNEGLPELTGLSQWERFAQSRGELDGTPILANETDGR